MDFQLSSTVLSLLCSLAHPPFYPPQEEFNVSCLTDSNADTYWESDGSQCQHWVRLTMKKGTIVK